MMRREILRPAREHIDAPERESFSNRSSAKTRESVSSNSVCGENLNNSRDSDDDWNDSCVRQSGLSKLLMCSTPVAYLWRQSRAPIE